MTLNKKILIILAFLVIIRIAMAIALIYGFPQKGEYGNGFYLGDEEEYFKVAFSLAKFNPVDSYRTLGFPILLLPFIWLAKANSFTQLLLPVSIFHACILAPISIVLVAFIAKKLAREWKVAIIAATIWTFFPYLVYIFVHTNSSFCKDVPAMRMAHQMWVQALSDPPSTFLVLVAIYAFLISLDKKNIIYPFLTGASFGLATLVRPVNIGLAILFLSFYLYKRELKLLFLFMISSFFSAFPQFIYNWQFYGSPFKLTTPFVTEKFNMAVIGQSVGCSLDAFSLNNLFISLRQIILKFPVSLLFITSVIFLIIIYTLFKLFKGYPRVAIILVLWASPYFLIYGSNWICISILHFLMPVIPAIIIILSVAIRRSLWFL